MSQNKIFRKVALDRLSSPEELDQRLTVTSPIGWLACLSIVVLMVAVIIWSIYGRIPDKAVGEGIIISSGGIAGIINHEHGQITDVGIQEGDYVTKGDVIARVEQTAVAEQIGQLKEDLAAIKTLTPDNTLTRIGDLNLNVYAQVYELARDIEYARSNLTVSQANLTAAEKNQAIKLEQAQWELQQATLQLEKNQDLHDKLQTLYANGVVPEQEYSDARRNLILSQSTLQNKKENLRNIEEEANALPHSQVAQARNNLEVLLRQFNDSKQIKIRDLEKQIADAQLKLMESSTIIADASGRVVELQVEKGVLVNPGSIICSIAKEEEPDELLKAIVYIPVELGKKVQPGMNVNISPSTVKKEEDGFMLGNVKSVSQFPASPQGMMLTLGSEELIRRLAGQGSSLEVKVELIRDSKTTSGYKWSTPKGPNMVIDSGTFCLGEVKVSQQRPINMVVPFIKKMFFD